ncbi:MAG: sulfatase, partial [Bacteroidota bacterium]
LRTFLLLLFSAISGYAQQPNFLFIISDDLNTQIGPYTNIENHTPNLNQLAKRGVKFSEAYCQFPLCGPSRASLMSGLYPETNGTLNNNDQLGSYRVDNPRLSDHPTLAGFFREQGYFTARVSKIFHMGVPGGIEQGAAGGDEPDSWDYAYNVMGPETLSQGKLELLSPKNLHYGGNFSRMVLPDSLDFTQTDYLAASQAIAILESRAASVAEGAKNKVKLKPDAPFFLAVGLVRPHVPLIAPERNFVPYPTQEVTLPEIVGLNDIPPRALTRQNNKVWGMSEQQQKETIAAYMASVQFMDEQVGRLLSTLDNLGLRENTIVVFVSDHGYNLGEHDCWSKVSLWEGSVRVPMIISAPGKRFQSSYGTTCETTVELIDLYPTLLGLAGYSEQQPIILQGKSLMPWLENSAYQSEEEYDAYTVSYGGTAASLKSGMWRYTRWGDQTSGDNEELYNHANDPEEHHNLVNDPTAQSTLEMMRNRLGAIQQKAQNHL